LGENPARIWLTVFAAAGAVIASSRGVLAAMPASVDDLANLSIEQLGNVEITSVSKSGEALGDAAAAIYVITHDDIVRSGATSIPEMLRMAPNLQVAQMSADSYAITARGFNGNAADKLLVLIDGRSVYTPLFGGVQWDEQDVLPENIERIEVISGPGATLWGANAVNGVINIITKNAADTQGGFADIGYGDRETRASLQYGGKIGSDLAWRVYGEGFAIPHDLVSTGARAEDGWTKEQGGFRLDWTPSRDHVTLQGDVYGGLEDDDPSTNTDIRGGNVQLTWQHPLDDGASFQLLSYYDATRRFAGTEGGFGLDTYDIDLQHAFSVAGWNDVVWGGGYRLYQDHFTFTGSVQYVPADRSTSLANVFAQDTITLDPALKLVLGVKLESDAYSSLTPLPNARLSWKPTDESLLWASASYAVRAPTRFDTDLQDTIVPGVLVLTGNPDFQPEKLVAYEAGGRVQPTSATTLSASFFYNVYDDLRSVEQISTTPLPILWTWGNQMVARTYGVEVWGSYGVTDWWKLSAGFNIQHEDRRFRPTSSALGGVAIAGDDPNHQTSLRSAMDIGSGLTLDADLRWIGMLPNPKVPEYVELNTRLAWDVSDKWQIALSGFNLLHAHHIEYELAGATTGDEVDRSVFVQARYRF
jgi:iron complex outermembrane recepter protein